MGVVLTLLFLWLLSAGIIVCVLELSGPAVTPKWACRDGTLRSRFVTLGVLPFVALLALLGQLQWEDVKEDVAYVFTGKVL